MNANTSLMKTKPTRSPRSIQINAPEVSGQNGAIKIHLARKPQPTRAAGSTSERSLPQKAGARASFERQPAPRIPGITKEMVRRHLPHLLKDKVLEHRPATLSEWLLVEWHLARKLHLSPLQLAHFISEAMHPPQPTHSNSRLLPAR
jgi:hypothetical protein